MSGLHGDAVFKTGVNQQIDAVLRLQPETRCCLFGTVLDDAGQPVRDAVVKLLQIVDGKPVPLTHTFTDEFGQFLLGPLCPCTKYGLKIYADNTQIVKKCLKVSSYDGCCINCNTPTCGKTSTSTCGCQD